MNKLELVRTLAEQNGLTKSEAQVVIERFFKSMADALESGDRVEIRGLCSFAVKKYAGYTGRNPKTGMTVDVADKKLPFFKCGKEMKERVNR